jgi:hypothetical protein
MGVEDGMIKEIKNYRMKQKRDFANVWRDSAVIPEDGEIITYKDDEGRINRFKIGDGVNKPSDLNFITGEVYVTDKEPEGAGDGALWVNPDFIPAGSSNGSNVLTQSDYE